MTQAQRLKCLSVPSGKIDAILDTDAFNEIDDQFAIAYMVKSPEKINVKAICAAPFDNIYSEGAADGMERSYNETQKLLSLMGKSVDVYRGSTAFLLDENTPQISEAARKMVEISRDHSSDNPLYIVAIGAITNVASALLIEPEMKERVVVVWLCGNAHHYHCTEEFNMKQDIAAARVVMGCGVPFIQLPCMGVVSSFTISKPELEFWLKGKNPIADYLATITVNEGEKGFSGTPWTRPIWDVTAVAWLLNDSDRFMCSRVIPTLLPKYDNSYDTENPGYPMTYVYSIKRDALMTDLINTILK